MSSETEFKCTRCDLNLTRNQIDEALMSVQSKAKAEEDYSFEGLQFSENPQEILISFGQLQIYGKKRENNYHFDRVQLRGYGLIYPIIDMIKEMFRRYKGTLEGYFEHEDETHGGHFIIENGEEIGIKQQRNGQEKISPIYINDAFRDGDRNLITSFVIQLLAPKIWISEYFIKIDDGDRSTIIPIVISSFDKTVMILIDSRPWTIDSINEMKDTLDLINKSKYRDALKYLISGYPPPSTIEDLFHKSTPPLPKIFVSRNDVQARFSEFKKSMADNRPLPAMTIDLDFQNLTNEKVKESAFTVAYSLPKSECRNVLEIGIRLDSPELIKHALDNHSQSFDMEMDYDIRYNSLIYLSERLKSTHNKFLFDYIKTNLDSWMTRENVGIGILPNLIEYSYSIKDQGLMDSCLKKIESIKDKDEKARIMKATGICFFKIGNVVQSQSFFNAAIDVIQEQHEGNMKRFIWVIIVEIEKYTSSTTLPIFKDMLNRLESILEVNDKDIRTLYSLMTKHLQIGDVTKASQLMERFELNIPNMKQGWLIDYANWQISLNAISSNNIPKFKKYILHAMTAFDSSSGWRDYGGDVLKSLARQNNPSGLEWAWDVLTGIHTPQLPPNWIKQKYPHAYQGLEFSLFNSYLIILKNRLEYKEKAYQEIRKLSGKDLLEFMHTLWKNEEVYSDELFSFLEERALANKEFEHFDSMLFTICFGYSKLFLQNKTKVYVPTIRRLRDMIKPLSTYQYVQKMLISILIELGEIDEAITESQSYIKRIKEDKTEDRSYRLVDFSKEQVESFKKSNRVEFIQLSLEAYNQAPDFERKKQLISQIMISLFDYCNGQSHPPTG